MLVQSLHRRSMSRFLLEGRSNTIAFSSYTPTEEQARVIESTGDTKVNAVAGSGKTATLIQYASRRPKERMLYLAFNKSVQQEAENKFKAGGFDHVDVKTAHSLAFNGTKEAFGGKIHVKYGNYTPYDIKLIAKKELASAFDKKPSKMGEMLFGSHVLKLCSLYCNSDAESPSDVDYLGLLTNPGEISFSEKRINPIVDAAKVLLEKMSSGEIESSHDYYLKRYQLSRPKLDYDVIMFDEGQDASPAMLDVVLKQHATKLFVGDEHQQIYSFRHAKNAMRLVDCPSLPMHTSFRFGRQIATLAKDILETKDILFRHFQPPHIRGVKGASCNVKTRAILGRTNAALLSHAIGSIESGTKKLYFEGGFNNYRFENSSSLYDVLNLHLGNKQRIQSKVIKQFENVEELNEFATQIDDPSLVSFVGIVKKYEESLFGKMNALRDSMVNSAERADLIYSTVHKAKGMEYDEVTLLEDFMSEDKLRERFNVLEETKKIMGDSEREFYNEEINMLYVAATRARCTLNISKSVVPKGWKEKRTVSGVNIYKPAP